MTDQELRDLVAENTKLIKELVIDRELRQQEADKRNQEADKWNQEADKRRRDIDKQIKNLGKEIGYIGNSFGRFTEGLFLPSLEKILLKDFGLDTVAPRIKRQKNGSNVELDVLSYSNSGKNTAIVVEIKSNLKYDDIIEFLDLLKKFPKFFPEHKDKKIYGMMAAVSISPEIKAKAEKFGLYVVKISDETFRLISDRKFKAKDFGLKK